MPYILAIDIGGTTVKLAIVRTGPQHEILLTDMIDTVALDPPERIASRIAEAGLALAKRSGAPVEGAGVGCPGLIDNVNGVVRKAGNLPTMRDFPLGKALSGGLGVPVALQNDANAAALGEYHFGGNRGCTNMVLITIGTGVGGGVICDGKLLVGNDNAAAELGHVKVEYHEPAPCTCGRRGCLEAYAGIEGIQRLARQVVASMPGSSIAGDLSTRELANAARSGNEAAREALKRVGIYLGRGIASFVEVFNPAKVILAGGASRATPFFLTGIEESLDQWSSFEFTRGRCVILASALPDTINVLGAAAVFLDATGQ